MTGHSASDKVIKPCHYRHSSVSNFSGNAAPGVSERFGTRFGLIGWVPRAFTLAALCWNYRIYAEISHSPLRLFYKPFIPGLRSFLSNVIGTGV